MGKDPTVVVPLDEVLVALELIEGEYGDTWRSDLPTLTRLWQTRHARARWLLDKRHAPDLPPPPEETA